MDHRTFRILIAVVLIIFVVVTLTFQSICAPDKNPVSAAVSSYVDKTFTEPAPQRVDPLSYHGVKKVIVRWDRSIASVKVQSAINRMSSVYTFR